MEEKPPQGNRTVCTIISVKIKQGAATHVQCEFYGKKVWQVNVKDVEWLAVELADDSEEITNIKNELYELEHNGHEHQTQTTNAQRHSKHFLPTNVKRDSLRSHRKNSK